MANLDFGFGVVLGCSELEVFDTDPPCDAVTASRNNPSRHIRSPSFSTGPDILDFKVAEADSWVSMDVFARGSLDSRSNDRDNDRAIGFWVNIIRIEAEAERKGDDRFLSRRILGWTDDKGKGEV